MSSRNDFLHGGMTPRAWRMISYSCIGFFIYGIVIASEALQNRQLNRIDQQMQRMNSMESSDILEKTEENIEVQISSPTLTKTIPPLSQQ